MTPTPTELAIIDRWQRAFPLTERPFEVVGHSVGLDENATISTLQSLHARKVITRIGAIVRPHTIGASTLAAVRVAPDRIDAIAALVNAERYVSHNYARQHALNLWFVIAGPHPQAISDTIANIEHHTGLQVIDLPIEKAYQIDLAFPLTGAPSPNRDAKCGDTKTPTMDYAPDTDDCAVIAAIEDGLPLTPRPYRDVSRVIGMGEAQIIQRLRQLQIKGVVARFGCVVRHRTLGYTSNAMAVWNVPDEHVDAIAVNFVRHPRVTLCYRRKRCLPDWPYNIFSMVHAKTRTDALAVIAELNEAANTARYDQAVLFSTHCYKQRGAVFSERMTGQC